MPSAQQANIEYFFRLLYELFGQRREVDYAVFQAFLAHVWTIIVIIGYIVAVLGFFIIIYVTVRLFELRAREHEYYGTVIAAPESGGKNARWEHIERLMEGGSMSEWREAIIEADIMLDDMLSRQGYVGDGVSEKLRMVERSDFNSLNNAWEAHKVRNRIAHDGMAFDLSETLAQRTIANYEAVFREFKLI